MSQGSDKITPAIKKVTGLVLKRANRLVKQMKLCRKIPIYLCFSI